MRVALGLIFAMLLSVAATQAQTGGAEARDLRRVEACLARMAKRKGSPYGCIGQISKACMEQPGGYSTLGMKVCTDRETDAWDRLLNRNYQLLRKKFPEAAAEKLKEIQRAWIEWKGTKCELGYVLFEGGTLAGVVAGSCVMETTAIRAIELGNESKAADN